MLACRCATGQHGSQDSRVPAAAPAGVLFRVQHPPLPAAAAARRNEAGRGAVLPVSGWWAAVVPGPGALVPWTDLKEWAAGERVGGQLNCHPDHPGWGWGEGVSRP